MGRWASLNQKILELQQTPLLWTLSMLRMRAVVLGGLNFYSANHLIIWPTSFNSSLLNFRFGFRFLHWWNIWYFIRKFEANSLNFIRKIFRGNRWHCPPSQDANFEPWRSKVDHATSLSRRLFTILNLWEWTGKKHVFLWTPIFICIQLLILCLLITAIVVFNLFY